MPTKPPLRISELTLHFDIESPRDQELLKALAAAHTRSCLSRGGPYNSESYVKHLLETLLGLATGGSSTRKFLGLTDWPPALLEAVCTDEEPEERGRILQLVP